MLERRWFRRADMGARRRITINARCGNASRVSGAGQASADWAGARTQALSGAQRIGSCKVRTDGDGIAKRPRSSGGRNGRVWNGASRDVCCARKWRKRSRDLNGDAPGGHVCMIIRHSLPAMRIERRAAGAARALRTRVFSVRAACAGEAGLLCQRAIIPDAVLDPFIAFS